MEKITTTGGALYGSGSIACLMKEHIRIPVGSEGEVIALNETNDGIPYLTLRFRINGTILFAKCAPTRVAMVAQMVLPRAA